MHGKLIHLRLPESLYSDIQEVIALFGFQSIADFLRDSARKSLEEYRLRKSIELLRSLKGSMKGKTKMLTKAERRKIFEEYAGKDPSDILRKYGLD